jgi:tRNA (cmo5U34)-methyltransferase
MDTHFDAAAKDWDDKPERRERAAAVAAAIRRRLPGDGRPRHAIELGCGTGLLSFALAGAFERILLIDSSAAMLEKLAEKIKAAGLSHLRPLRADLDDFPAGRFRADVVYALLALHHVRDHLKLVGWCFEALNPGGLLFIADLVKEDGSFHSHIPDFAGYNGFSVDWLKHDLKNIGFACVDSEIVFTMRRPVNGVEREYPLFLLTAVKGSTGKEQ